MDIKDSYLHGTVGVVKSISVSADKLKYKLADIAGTVKEVTLPVATTSANGLMSSADKSKLDAFNSGSLKNNLVLKIDSGTTEGTSLYTYNGSADKTLDIKSGTGIAFSKTAGALQIFNSGVRSIATGTTNGTISVNTNGTSANVAVKGLGSAAYTSSDSYVKWNSSADTYYNIYQKSYSSEGYVRVLYLNVDGDSVFGYGYNPTKEVCYITNYKKGYDLQLADSLYYRNKTIAYTDSNITGNAATATKLQTKRKLWGLDFDGSADVDGQATMTGSSTDLYWSCKGSKYQIGFGIGNGNVNRGIYDFTNKHWWIFKSDKDETYIPDGNVGIGTSSPAERLQVNGNVKATSFIGNLDGTYVNKLTNYTKATAIGAIAATDSLNTALGKLEYKADTAYDLVKGAYDGDGTIENLAEILKVLEGIKDTETIKAIIGKYLPLTGGTLDGSLYIGKADNTDYKFLQLTRGGHGLRLNNISTGAYLSFGTTNSGNDFTAEKSLLLGDSGLFYTYDLTAWHAIIHAANYRSYLPFLNSTSTHAANDSVIYAPTTVGTSGYILKSNGSGAPTWIDPSTIAVGKTKVLDNYYTSRPTSLNIKFGDGGLRTFKATSATTEGKCTGDGHIIHLAWDATNGWDNQLAITCANYGKNFGIQFRGQNEGTWSDWHPVLTDLNYHEYLGYIGYNKVQTSSKSQSLTGISSIRYQNESSEFMFIGNPASVDSTQTTGGAILAYNNGPLRFYAGAKQILTINANSTVRINGKLGIDVNPTFSLHADGAVKATSYVGTNIRIECDKDGVLGNKYNEINNYTDTLDLNYSSSTTMSLCVGGGKVGIGTRTPSSKLDVIGVLKCNQYIDIRDISNTKNRLTFQISSGIGRLYTYSDEDSTFRTLYLGRNDPNAIVITADGNVSIGRDTPRLKLDVSGNVLATKFITTDGTSSLFVKGDGSLDSNTYVTVSGSLKNPNVIKFKNTSGTEVSYDGSTAVDLTQGIFEAMRLARTTFTEGYDLNTIKKEHVYVSSATNICASLVNGPTSRSNGEARLESITCGSNSWGFLTLYTRVGSNYEIWYRTWNSEAFTSWVQNIHSGNYTDYTVKKDGTGATGTWGISITGNAGSASTSSKLSSTTVISAKALSLSNASWTDTGYTFESLASGTYAVQVTCGNLVASGIMSVYKSIDDTAGDEIPLHVYHDSTQPWRPYLRTSGKKLLISSNDGSATSRTVTIKIALIL